MENIKIGVPYAIGTYLDKIEDGKRHIDQVYEYIINQNGIFAILLLDVIENPRLSTRISIEELNDKYTLTQDVHLNISEENVRATCEIFSKVKNKTKQYRN